MAREKEQMIEEYRKQLEHFDDEHYSVEDANIRKEKTKEDMEQELEKIKSDHDFELMYQRSYYHMLDRMRKDLISAQIKSNDLFESKKQKESGMPDEIEKSRKSKESRM